VSQLPKSTFVVTDPSEIVRALVGLKAVRVLAYIRRGSDVELMVEQIVEEAHCPACGDRAKIKERPVAHYVDLPVYGTPMSLAWKKHRKRCVNRWCAKRSWVLSDHRIAAKHCLLTTRVVAAPAGSATTDEVARLPMTPSSPRRTTISGRAASFACEGGPRPFFGWWADQRIASSPSACASFGLTELLTPVAV
jgi:hypothetical protein